MKIGEVIRSYRKKAKLTQEDVANCLNISTPAVNKWENGVTYPDITLLPALARLLKTDINTLLSFNEELEDRDIKRLVKELDEVLSKDGYEKGFEKGSKLIEKYSNCGELAIRIITMLRIYMTANEIYEKDRYERKIIDWLEGISISNKESIVLKAKFLLVSIYREREQYDKAHEVLNKIPEPVENKNFQKAILYKSSKNFQESYSICEEIILMNSHEIVGALSLIIEMLCNEKKFDELKEYLECTKSIIDAVELGEYYKNELQLYVAQEKQDKEKTIEMVRKTIDEANSMSNHMKSNLYKHMNFNKSVCEYNEKQVVKDMMKKKIEGNKEFNFIKDDFRIKSILE